MSVLEMLILLSLMALVQCAPPEECDRNNPFSSVLGFPLQFPMNMLNGVMKNQ
ncbi:hypothetical protein O3G_MSEX014294 [Manduca sexta]|uniref:Uncharacterized protein n=1 Tax=Manduca sexta TaxID=7130 RepID=A0A921ZUB2_MANSE|nr:hypothetical protein O3G_MSEX014294 [Manduca sexta]